MMAKRRTRRADGAEVFLEEGGGASMPDEAALAFGEAGGGAGGEVVDEGGEGGAEDGQAAEAEPEIGDLVFEEDGGEAGSR